MVDNIPTDFIDSKLMKSLFSIKDTLAMLRGTSPLAIGTLSVGELYDLMIEVIDLVVFMRKTQQQFASAKLNRGMKEVDLTPDTPGGLIPIKVRINPIVPFSANEELLLEQQQQLLIRLKNTLGATSILGYKPARLSEKTDIAAEMLDLFLDSAFMVELKSGNPTRKKSRKHNAHFARLRKTKR
jgi:hypothetical protein